MSGDLLGLIGEGAGFFVGVVGGRSVDGRGAFGFTLGELGHVVGEVTFEQAGVEGVVGATLFWEFQSVRAVTEVFKDFVWT